MAARARRRAVALAATAALVVAGMNYSIGWAVDVRHQDFWDVGVDLWATYVDARNFVEGHFSQVYAHHLVTFPGILVVLAPAVLVCQLLHLPIGMPFTAVSYPTAWIVLGPYTMVVSAVALFAADAAAERLGVAVRRRAVLAAFEVVALWSPAVWWGHPEDPLAVGLALYALMDAVDSRWRRCGWLLGAAICVQPVTVMVLPVVCVLAGRRWWWALAWRAALPAMVLVAPELAASWHTTVRAIVDQPNYPTVDHPTPFLRFAPRLSVPPRTVAAGPMRLAAVTTVVAITVGAARHVRRTRDLAAVLWLVAVAFALRACLESVMDGYYLWPVLAVALVVAAVSPRRLVLAGAVSAFTTASSFWSWKGQWSWWLLMSVCVLAVLALAVPWRAREATAKAAAGQVAPVST